MTKIIQRHDTAANWTSVNPVLAAGEMGVEIDTNKFKFGNGSSTWSELPYATSGGTGGSGTQLTSADGATSYSTLALGNNLVVDTGDIAWTNPAMSSASQDGYILTASSSSSADGAAIYKAFDKDTTTSENCWYTGSVSMPQWIMLECPEPVRVTSCMIKNELATPENFKNAYIQGSNDGSSFDTLYTITNRPNTTGYSETYNFTNNKYYKYLRVYFTESYSGGISIQEIEFKGFIKDPSAVPSLNVNIIDELLVGKQDKLTAEKPLNIGIKDTRILNVSEGITGGNLTDTYNYTLSSNMSGNGFGLVTNEIVNFNTAATWEVVLKTSFVKGGSATSPELNIISTLHEGFTILCHYDSSKNLYIRQAISSKLNSWDYIKDTPTTNIPLSSISSFRVKFDGTSYNFSYSTDDLNYITLSTYNSSARIPNDKIGICRYFSSEYYWAGTVSLTDSYYKINDTITPLGIIKDGTLTISSEVATTSSLGVVKPDGTSITVDDAGVISGQDVKTFTGYSDTGTLVLKSINGVLQWVAE